MIKFRHLLRSGCPHPSWCLPGCWGQHKINSPCFCSCQLLFCLAHPAVPSEGWLQVPASEPALLSRNVEAARPGSKGRSKPSICHLWSQPECSDGSWGQLPMTYRDELRQPGSQSHPWACVSTGTTIFFDRIERPRFGERLTVNYFVPNYSSSAGLRSAQNTVTCPRQLKGSAS